MMLLLLILLTLLFVPLHSYQLSESLLRKKMREPLPEWAEQRIAQDLAPFATQGASRRAIDETLGVFSRLPRGENAQFVCFEICKNQIHCFSPKENLQDARITHFIEFFQQASCYLHFPDVRFLATIWDCFDSPLYVHHLRCAVFSYSKRKSNSHVILMPETREFHYIAEQRRRVEETAAGLPWQQRISKAFWRGNSTGGYYHFWEFDHKPRPQLVLFSMKRPDLVDARLSGNYFLDKDVEGLMSTLGMFDRWLDASEQLRYRYLIAVDGNSLASNMKWLPFSKSVILKSDSDYIDWYYDGLVPWVHYVPYSYDCTDLATRVEWLRSHDSEAKTIAEQAYDFAHQHLSWEDVAIYYYHLLTEFAKLQRAQ